MRPDQWRVDPDLRFAATPPRELYVDRGWWDAVAERVLARGWHVAARREEIAARESVRPLTLLPGVLDEPVLLTRDRKDRLHALSNVCTHRANVVATECGPAKMLRCGYHGRTFRLDGEMLAAPGMEGALDFPSPSDSLPRLAAAEWGPLVFAALDPDVPFEDLLRPVRERCAHLDLAALRFDAEASADHEVDAHWALYVENYLEGFHVPFVHAGLAKALDPGAYAVEPVPHGVVQVGVVPETEPAFALPDGHPDAGRRVGAWWFWLHPGTMLNVYPWGLSVNVVEPLGASRTRVRFLTFVGDASLRGRGAGADLGRVEAEDEAIVAAVQRGVRSRRFRPGRYSPRHEAGVHHFHRLLAARLAPL